MSKVKLFFCGIAFQFVLFVCKGQDAAKIPAVIPPSPEVASLANIGNINVGMHTGFASMNIPLFDVSTGNFKLPVALSYSSNGIKVNEIPSRVGLGWNLVRVAL